MRLIRHQTNWQRAAKSEHFISVDDCARKAAGIDRAIVWSIELRDQIEGSGRNYASDPDSERDRMTSMLKTINSALRLQSPTTTSSIVVTCEGALRGSRWPQVGVRVLVEGEGLILLKEDAASPF
jgi:hypothetical protein